VNATATWGVLKNKTPTETVGLYSLVKESGSRPHGKMLGRSRSEGRPVVDYLKRPQVRPGKGADGKNKRVPPPRSRLLPITEEKMGGRTGRGNPERRPQRATLERMGTVHNRRLLTVPCRPLVSQMHGRGHDCGGGRETRSTRDCFAAKINSQNQKKEPMPACDEREKSRKAYSEAVDTSPSATGHNT